jgi:hypothetical protein
MSDDLVVWLTQILDEEEKAAQAVPAAGGPYNWHPDIHRRCIWGEGGPDGDQAMDLIRPIWAGGDDQLLNHVAQHDPSAALARIRADRQILTFWAIWNKPDENGHLREDTWALATRHAIKIVLYQLALVHSSRPGYREEWRP